MSSAIEVLKDMIYPNAFCVRSKTQNYSKELVEKQNNALKEALLAFNKIELIWKLVDGKDTFDKINVGDIRQILIKKKRSDGQK